MYIMSYFFDEDQTMRIATGPNLFAFSDANNNQPVLDVRSNNKLIRDPFLVKDESGTYQLYFTDNWYSNTLGHAASTDFIHWSEPEYIKVMGDNEDVANCWAPELCYDRERESYMLFWSSSFYSLNNEKRISNRIWYCHTKDFKTYTKAQMLYDPGHQVIDASIHYFKGKYYMAFKDERGHNAPGTNYAAIRTTCSTDITGPYEDYSPLLTPFRSEGPFLFEEDGFVYMFFDSFGDASYRCIRTVDFKTWEDVSKKLSFPKNCKHLCIMKDN